MTIELGKFLLMLVLLVLSAISIGASKNKSWRIVSVAQTALCLIILALMFQG